MISSSVSSLAQSSAVLTAVLDPAWLEARLVSLLLLAISAAARLVRSRVNRWCRSGDTGEIIVKNRKTKPGVDKVKLQHKAIMIIDNFQPSEARRELTN